MATLETISQNLLTQDENELLAQLGARSQVVEANPTADSLDALEEGVSVPRGAFDDLLKVGKKIFVPASAQAFKLLCSPIGGDGELAAELDKLMNEKTAEAAAKMTTILTPILVGSLGLPQSLAVIVGSLIVKQLAKGISNFACENWKATLSDPTPTNSAPTNSSESPDMAAPSAS